MYARQNGARPEVRGVHREGARRRCRSRACWARPRPSDDFTLDDVRAARARLGERVVETPVRELEDDLLAAAVGDGTESS